MSWQRPNIGSRVTREGHARFWERPGLKLLRATRHNLASLRCADYVRFTPRTDVVPAPGEREVSARTGRRGARIDGVAQALTDAPSLHYGDKADRNIVESCWWSDGELSMSGPNAIASHSAPSTAATAMARFAHSCSVRDLPIAAPSLQASSGTTTRSLHDRAPPLDLRHRRLESARQRHLAPLLYEERVDQCRDCRCGAGPARHLRPAQRGNDLRRAPAHDFCDDGLLVGEVLVERADRTPARSATRIVVSAP